KRVWVRIQPGSTKDASGNSVGFRLKLAYWVEDPASFPVYDPFEPVNRTKLPRPQALEDYDDLSIDPRSSDYFMKRLVDPSTNLPVSALGAVDRPGGGTSMPQNTAPEGVFLDQLGDEDAGPLGTDDYDGGVVAGHRDQLSGLLALELDPYRDVALVY